MIHWQLVKGFKFRSKEAQMSYDAPFFEQWGFKGPRKTLVEHRSYSFYLHIAKLCAVVSTLVRMISPSLVFLAP